MKSYFTLLILIAFGAIQCDAQPFWERVDVNAYGQFFAMTDNGNVYAMRNSTALQMSTMDGAMFTWNQLTGYPYIFGNNVTAVGNTVIVCNSNDNTFNGRGIYMSTDDGATWQSRNSGLGADTNVVMVHELANGVLMAHATQSNGTNRLYRSTNMGLNWSFVQDLGGDYPSHIHAVSGTEAYFSAFLTVYKSTDNGLTWVDLSANTGGHSLSAFVVMPNGDMIGHGWDTLLKSTDHGVTWNGVATVGLPSLSGGGNALIKSPGDTLYTCVNAMDGIYYSADGGTTWASTGTGINFPTQVFIGMLMISKRGYLFVSPGIEIWRSILPVSANLVGIERQDFPGESLLAYPNPAKGDVLISGAELDEGELEVDDLYGRAVRCASSYVDGRWRIQGLAPGMYCYRIGERSGKLIIEH
ncbi:MAG: hypothetical protein U0176_13155 [Bacteroidia bacterium]